MVAEEVEIVAVTVVVTGAVIEVDAAEVEIVVVIAVETVAAQAAAATKSLMAQAATDQLIKVVVTANPTQAVQQPVRIRTEVAAGLQEENHGIKNKPENRERRRKDSRKLESGI